MIKIKKLEIAVNEGGDIKAVYDFDDYQGVDIGVICEAVEAARAAFCRRIEREVMING